MSVFVADEQAVPVDVDGLRHLAERVLDEEGLPDDTEVAVVFVDEAQIAEYHRRFLGQAGPTDVLSFPIEDLVPGETFVSAQGDPPLNLGDVFVCPAVVGAKAAKRGVPFAAEMELMVVHGLLHLLGYDHESDEDADEMEARERELLAGAETA